MKKGFTLLELIIVIIIIGVLATLGFTQYGRTIEKSRGAEARAIAGNIRTLAAAFRLEYGTCLGFGNTQANIGTGADQIPSACAETHYFSYAVSGQSLDGLTITATRCGATGKGPATPSAGDTLILTINFTTGADTWTGTGNY